MYCKYMEYNFLFQILFLFLSFEALDLVFCISVVQRPFDFMAVGAIGGSGARGQSPTSQ